MKWKRPVIIEIGVGLEINAYACGEPELLKCSRRTACVDERTELVAASGAFCAPAKPPPAPIPPARYPQITDCLPPRATMPRRQRPISSIADIRLCRRDCPSAYRNRLL